MNFKTAVLQGLGTAVIAVGAGYLGSAVHEWVRTRQVTPSDLVRAKRFEVVNESGQILSYWGPDNSPRIPASTNRGVLLVFMDLNGTRRCQIGSRVGDYGPELLFYDPDGPSEAKQKYSEPRFGVMLGYNHDADLVMRSRDSWRILLGAVHGDAPGPSEDTWGLRIRGGRTSEVGVLGFKTHFGRYTAGVFAKDKEAYWSMPPDLVSRLNQP